MTDIETSTVWRQACAAAIAGLPDMTIDRLSKALTDMDPEEVWTRFAEGELVPSALGRANEAQAKLLMQKWRAHVRSTNPLDVLEQYHQKGISVWTPRDDFPMHLMNDPERPGVLFWRGTPQALARPAVAIIGTRRASGAGRDIASKFACELAEAGVAVVSGLALGIDGAAHRGALSAMHGAETIGVVGSGLDIVYPHQHRDLWNEVGERGLLISESPLRVTPEPWRFPARNRIIAGLADIVLVIESPEKGGSMLTVKNAIDRGVPVMAVPGSVKSPMSKGSNLLLRDGCVPAIDTEDVLMALQTETGLLMTGGVDAIQTELPIDEVDNRVLEAIGWDPSTTDDVLDRLDLSLGEVAVALARLQQGGWVANLDGWWRRC